MKYISITPTKFMSDALKTSDTTLVLAHLIEEGNDYQKACLNFQKSGGKLIMDNSFYELRKNMPTAELAKKAILINADIVVLPDLPLRDNLTFLVGDTIKKLREYGIKSRFMMCVFADNTTFKEDLKQFRILDSIKELDIIAIPYVFREDDEYRRPDFLDLIEKEIGVGEIKHQVHLFGCNSLENINKEKRKWIQSIDGSMSWKVGFYKIKLPVSVEMEPRRPKHYFSIENVDDEQKECINYNLKYLKGLCEDGS